MNLANLGKAGILVAQSRLQTAGHNINNSATEGYNRQRVMVQSAGAGQTAAGWVGRGVQAVSVQRAYDSFLYSQLAESRTRGAALATYGDQISQVNNLLADRTVGITPAIQAFFDGVQAVATAPADSAARQELLGRANSLVTQIKNANAFLDEQRSNINTQVRTTVTQVNSILDRIQDLNRQISTAKAVAPGQPPNDLFDQRDQLVAELSQIVDVQIFEQDDRVNITVANGQVLLGGDSVFHLDVRPSASDPSRLAVNYSIPNGVGGSTAVELSDSLITGGTLGGLLSFRREALDTVQNDLGRLAVGLAMAVNEIHGRGYDLTGAQGGDFFALAAPKVIRGEGNAVDMDPAVRFVNPDQLTAQDYRVSYDGASYVVTRVSDGAVLAVGNGILSFDGLEVDVSGMAGAAPGDGWLIQPTRDAAASLAVALDDPARIAAAGGVDHDGVPATPNVGAGSANGDIALEWAALQTRKVLGNGAMSLNEAYAQIVNKVGVLTQQNSTAQKAQETLIQQNYSAQQALSGVNLNEEYMNLNQYQEQFRAASRLIDVSSTLFDTLLSLRS
ncbi:flagellar hook-associated protein FlgK [Castellaniella sp. GW247-6E4]|uniref:flagellar hook-associated protein FlgK n=1 Tax=Castellaniella sp. GW247-6E4 TaxID=3140380 RepID=UPI0033162380